MIVYRNIEAQIVSCALVEKILVEKINWFPYAIALDLKVFSKGVAEKIKETSQNAKNTRQRFVKLSAKDLDQASY